MPTNLSNGYKKPNAGESGDIFCPVLEYNWERVSEHSHDGSDSELLDSTIISKGSGTAASGSWVADGSLYKQTITLPTDATFDNTNIRFKDSSTEEIAYLEYKKVSDTTFDVWTNDNTATYTIMYV